MPLPTFMPFIQVHLEVYRIRFVPSSLLDARQQQQLTQIVDDIAATCTVPSEEATSAFCAGAFECFGNDCFDSCTIGYHADRVSYGVEWSVTCSDERATARTWAAFRNRAWYMTTNSVDYDDARTLTFPPGGMPSEDDVRTILGIYERDVAGDHVLAQVFRRRCGLGQTDASGWSLERIPYWSIENVNEGNASE